MKRWKTWIAGALALAGLAAAPTLAEARSVAMPDLIPLQAATPVGDPTTPAASPTCQYGYYHHGWRGRRFHGRHYGWRRGYGYRRHYGYRRPYGWRRPYGYRHRFYRPIGFYGRPYGYGYGYRHYGW